MSVSYLFPEFEVVRSETRCTACRICEKQCACGVHSFDEKTKRMRADESSKGILQGLLHRDGVLLALPAMVRRTHIIQCKANIHSGKTRDRITSVQITAVQSNAP